MIRLHNSVKVEVIQCVNKQTKFNQAKQISMSNQYKNIPNCYRSSVVCQKYIKR